MHSICLLLISRKKHPKNQMVFSWNASLARWIIIFIQSSYIKAKHLIQISCTFPYKVIWYFRLKKSWICLIYLNGCVQFKNKCTGTCLNKDLFYLIKIFRKVLLLTIEFPYCNSTNIFWTYWPYQRDFLLEFCHPHSSSVRKKNP